MLYINMCNIVESSNIETLVETLVKEGNFTEIEKCFDGNWFLIPEDIAILKNIGAPVDTSISVENNIYRIEQFIKSYRYVYTLEKILDCSNAQANQFCKEMNICRGFILISNKRNAIKEVYVKDPYSTSFSPTFLGIISEKNIRPKYAYEYDEIYARVFKNIRL